MFFLCPYQVFNKEMASSVSENPVEQECSCCICLHSFSSPVTLPCGHSFCLTCMEKSKSVKEGLSDNHCPTCRAEYQNSEFALRNLKLENTTGNYKATVHETAEVAPQREVEVEVMEQKDEPSCSTQGEAECEALHYTGKDVADHSDCIEMDLSAELSKYRSRLTPVMMDIQAKIELVDDLLAKAKEKEAAVKTVNTDLKAEVKMVLEEMVELLRSYSTAGMEFLEAQLRPREEVWETSVQTLSDLHRQLKETELQVNTLLEEQDQAKICKQIPEVEKHATSLIVETQKIGANAENINMSHMCEEMEHRNSDLRLKLGAAQRRLRNILNPSEMTFDCETLHPCLVLSEDRKTVAFSVVKQPYPAGPQRFTNYFQALSSQSFYKGEHCWILQAEGCPWVLGLCYGGLPRSGSESGLESRSEAWCLMWYDNLLRAYEGGRETPLKRTPFFQKLEIHLSFSKNCVTFSSISNVTGAKTHLHTFNVNFTEPVYLAVRMMSGQPKARITCNSV
ncbi:E3 ubiquitin-protein ligase TRIM21 isoform X1 [Hemibagrus wyckioides]|uniref:E3 ubiquitin-protein ligase TRIM21 isoform X1 n=2 Tax=Hemibagrus wyckioides TaxID=337641 RepID=UPI00266BFC40|nr:E3 ubiquitin-protein ligase TRIM21 isoform X1 [Hemibagrus wyckioides]XP_058258047.1 E3 ubiquitin-protein ligase TRIM21 isoform X1 [Hemibagrus wyckioides]XP_058258048.1 E3 ubiquitin-protein ligase TRIM21 isoform X1 [Hemibagrus wyckioides]